MSTWTTGSVEDFEDVEELLPYGAISGQVEPSFMDYPSDEQNLKTPNPKGNPHVSSESLLPQDDRVMLRRTLGIPGAVGIGLGIILGSGIFISPAGVVKNSGSVGEALIIWTVCGVFSTIGGLCFAELGITIPKSGGDYTYLLEIFGPFWAFMRLWIEVIVIRPSSHAIIALTFADYALQPFYSHGSRPPPQAIQLLGITCVGFLTYLNCKSVKWATRLQTVFTAAKVAALILIIVLGVIEISKGRYENFRAEVLFKGSITDPGKISMAMYAGLWAFSGWNEINYIVDEIKNPARNLPISVILSITTTTLLYIAVNVSYFTLLTPEQMEGEDATAVLFGRMVLGDYSYIIPICVALSCFGGINGSLFTASRFFFTGACNGHLPMILAMINIRSLSPIPSISLISLFTLFYMTTDDLFALINYSNFVYFFAMGFSILGLIVIRIRCPRQQKVFKLPLVLPMLAVLVCLATGILSFLQAPEESGVGVGVVLTAIPVYLIFVVARKPVALRRVLRRITVILQCLTVSVPEEK